MRTQASRLGVLWLVAIAVIGCGDDDGSSAVESVTELIGPAGGTLELSNGGKVTIPAGALSDDVEITITKLNDTDVAPLPSHMEATGKPFAFKPHGQLFAQDITIEVPYEGSDLDVRPMKLPNEVADTSQWTTVFPSEKDSDTNKLSIDTRSFSVIWGARPRRNSGVFVLPDGAIDPDTSDASVTTDGSVMDASVMMDGSVTMDAGPDAVAVVDANLDANLDASVSVPCDAMVTQATGVASVEVVTAGSTVLVSSGSNLVTAYAPSGNTLTSLGPVISLAVGEYFNMGGIAAAGNVVVGATSRGGISTTGRVYISHLDTLGSDAGVNPTVYDLAAYSAYWAAVNPVVPHGGRVAVQDGFAAVVEEATLGNLLVFDLNTAQPLGFLGTSDLNTSPLAGVVGMVVHDGFLVAAIDRVGTADPLNAIRTFDLRDPANIVMVDEQVRTGVAANALVYNPSLNRYYLSLGTAGQIALFTVDSAGMIGPETMIATTRPGAQARAMTVVGGNLLAVATPNFNVQPVDVAIDLFTAFSDTLTPLGTVDLPNSPPGDYGTSLASDGVIYSAGATELNVIDVSACLVD